MMEAIEIKEKIGRIELACLQERQRECSVIHRFGPGIYIREVSIPGDTFAIGHYQKTTHQNVMLKGRVTVLKDDGTTAELKAPTIFVGKPGRKIGYIHEDMVWLNIYSTEETDVEKLEKMFLDKSDNWIANDEARYSMEKLKHEGDREDYERVLLEVGISHETVRAQTENMTDQIDVPLGGYKVKLGNSPIEGKGLFATANIEVEEIIAPARIDGKRTFAGRYTNHSIKPNAEMVLLPNKNIHLIAIDDIAGCQGGNDGDEITIDYRQALSLSLKEMEGLCRA